MNWHVLCSYSDLKNEFIRWLNGHPTQVRMDGIKGEWQMLREAHHPNGAQSVTAGRPIIQTTLYELIAVVNETLNPTEDRIVTAIVMDMLNSGHAGKANPPGNYC